MKVLFIDDEPETQLLVKAMGRLFPAHKFEIVFDLADAWAKVTKDLFDVLVIDVMMEPDDALVPGSSELSGLLSGIKFAELVANREGPNKKTPVVLLTGVFPGVHRALNSACRHFGDRFVQKPVHPQDLMCLLENAKTGGQS